VVSAITPEDSTLQVGISQVNFVLEFSCLESLLMKWLMVPNINDEKCVIQRLRKYCLKFAQQGKVGDRNIFNQYEKA
jgi:hypothetical protein